MSIQPGAWATAQDVKAGLAAALSRAANLSDLSNPVLAQAHLGLRGMAVQDPAAVNITGGTIVGVNLGTPNDPVGYVAVTNLNIFSAMTAPPTGDFWSNDGATIIRLNDRLLVGAATLNDAAKPNVTRDWLSNLVGWPVYNGTAAITSAFGTIGLTVGSQTADLDPVAASSTETTIGIAAFGIANNPGTFPTGYFGAYAYYGEARVYPGTVSNAFGAELNAVNLSGTNNATPTPYAELSVGSTQALRLASGGGQGLSPHAALSAISIVPNEATFNVGIVFDAGSLTGADGTDGFATAIAFAKGHLLTWFAEGSGNGQATMTITSAIQNPANAVSMQAQDGGWLFLQPNGQIGFQIATVANVANDIAVVPGASATAAGIEARGSGTNLNLALRARPGGHLELRSSTQATAVAGSGGALPATVAAYLDLTIDDGDTVADYAVPLYATS